MSENQIFYPKLWWRLLPIPILIFAAWQCSRLYFEFVEDASLAFLSVWMTLCFVYACFWSYVFSCKTRLIVTPEGLQIEGVYVAHVSWNAILGISSNTFSFSLMPQIRTWGLAYYSEGSKRKEFLPLGHIIPRPPHESVEMLAMLMGVDWQKFKATEFGQILYQHAPQLFPENASI